MTKLDHHYIDKKIWLWTEQVQEKVQEKKQTFKKWQVDKSKENRQNYVTTKRAAKIAVAEARAEHYQDLHNHLETRKWKKDIYRLAKAQKKAAQDINHHMCIKEKDDKQLQYKQEILQ
ncbi:hypothetical protein E2320_009933 [Naja naja]|nr:hypothetical protein E2320_009933 [Naja naja]